MNSQSIEFATGINSNRFYDINDDSPYNRSEYSSNPGIYMSIGVCDLQIDSFEFYINIRYENYRGTAWGRSGGLGGGISMNVKTNKNLISLDISPFNQTIYKQFNIRLSAVLSFLLSETFNGSKTQSAGNSPTTIDLHEITNSFNSDLYFGFQGRFSYDYPINDNLILSPHYIYYIGFLDEFQDFPKATKSMRHYLGIALKMNL